VLLAGASPPVIKPGDPVLVAIAEHTHQRSVILGLVGGAAVAAASDQPEDAHRIRHRRIHVEATEELILKCGDAHIQIRGDGKVTIRGEHILSRATVTHKIKGGSVAIN
jgi:hypothetical protein